MHVPGDGPHPGPGRRRQHAQKLAVLGAILRNLLVHARRLERGEESIDVFRPKRGDGVCEMALISTAATWGAAAATAAAAAAARSA